MIRFLPFVIPAVAIAVVLVAIRFVLGGQTAKQPVLQLTSTSSNTVTTTDSELAERVRSLEEVVAALIQKVNSISTATSVKNSGSSNATVEQRLKVLETAVNDLKVKVINLDNITPTPISTSTKYPMYIPMGNSYSLNNDSWTTLDSFEVSFDPADYPGYSGVQLEVSMRVISSLGKAYARLYNNSDGSVVTSSEISTNSDKFVLVTSSNIKLSTGKKYYRLQVKSQGYEGFFVNPRIKINF